MKRIISDRLTPADDITNDVIRVGVPQGKAYTCTEIHMNQANATACRVYVLINGEEMHSWLTLQNTKIYSINDKLPEGTEVIVRVIATVAGAGLAFVSLVLDENE